MFVQPVYENKGLNFEDILNMGPQRDSKFKLLITKINTHGSEAHRKYAQRQ
jgi:hypothetical protein